MYSLLCHLLFQLDPETSHQLTLHALRLAGNYPLSNWFLTQLYKTQSKPVQAFGLTFKNSVGLAAGYDKDALAIKGLAALGFGHIEIGTVTPKPQAGNPRPRVFRLLEDEAAINWMGFPSRGAGFVRKKISVRSDQLSAVVGVNLGKNKDTPLEEAARDYVELMKVFAPLADYLTSNISSPNTVGCVVCRGARGWRGCWAKYEIRDTRYKIRDTRYVSYLVKISPDLSDEELDDAVGVILDKEMDGIIAANTTLSREGAVSKLKGETGGLSGSPLKIRSEAVLSRVVKRVNGKVPIISAGGIMSPDDAKKRLARGRVSFRCIRV